MARKSRKVLIPATPVPIAYIRTAHYVRLSVEADKKHESSIENQILILNNYIEDKPEFRVQEVYIDSGISGTTFQRPAFQKLLADIEAGLIDCVMVKDLSRLGRNSIDTGYYIEQYFRTYNIRFIAVTDQFDTADADNLHGGIMLPLKNMVNEAYALDISRKIKAQAHQAMKDGDFIGGRAPYGYRKDPSNCHKLLVDEATAPVVRQIFQWAYEGGGLNDLCVRLNTAKILPPSHHKLTTGEIAASSAGLIGNGTWQTWTVNKILRDEVYIGNMVQGKSITVDHIERRAPKENHIRVNGTHEPIIAPEIYYAVQEIRDAMAAKAKSRTKTPYTPNIFKGKIFCAHCGKPLHRQRSKRKLTADIYVFHCLTNSRVEKGACPGVLLTEEVLITTVTEILEKELALALGMSLPVFQREAELKKQQDDLRRQISDREQELAEITKKIRVLYEHLTQQIITRDEFVLLKEDYSKQSAIAKNAIKEMGQALCDLDSQHKAYQEMELDAKQLAQDHTLTAELIQRLIQRIEITHEKKIRISFRFRSEFVESEV